MGRRVGDIIHFKPGSDGNPPTPNYFEGAGCIGGGCQLGIEELGTGELIFPRDTSWANKRHGMGPQTNKECRSSSPFIFDSPPVTCVPVIIFTCQCLTIKSFPP